jgi:hypothetical protein
MKRLSLFIILCVAVAAVAGIVPSAPNAAGTPVASAAVTRKSTTTYVDYMMTEESGTVTVRYILTPSADMQSKLAGTVSSAFYNGLREFFQEYESLMFDVSAAKMEFYTQTASGGGITAFMSELYFDDAARYHKYFGIKTSGTARTPDKDGVFSDMYETVAATFFYPTIAYGSTPAAGTLNDIRADRAAANNFSVMLHFLLNGNAVWVNGSAFEYTGLKSRYPDWFTSGTDGADAFFSDVAFCYTYARDRAFIKSDADNRYNEFSGTSRLYYHEWYMGYGDGFARDPYASTRIQHTMLNTVPLYFLVFGITAGFCGLLILAAFLLLRLNKSVGGRELPDGQAAAFAETAAETTGGATGAGDINDADTAGENKTNE